MSLYTRRHASPYDKCQKTSKNGQPQLMRLEGLINRFKYRTRESGPKTDLASPSVVIYYQEQEKLCFLCIRYFVILYKGQVVRSNTFNLIYSSFSHIWPEIGQNQSTESTERRVTIALHVH